MTYFKTVANTSVHMYLFLQYPTCHGFFFFLFDECQHTLFNTPYSKTPMTTFSNMISVIPEICTGCLCKSCSCLVMKLVDKLVESSKRSWRYGQKYILDYYSIIPIIPEISLVSTNKCCRRSTQSHALCAIEEDTVCFKLPVNQYSFVSVTSFQAQCTVTCCT